MQLSSEFNVHVEPVDNSLHCSTITNHL